MKNLIIVFFSTLLMLPFTTVNAAFFAEEMKKNDYKKWRAISHAFSEYGATTNALFEPKLDKPYLDANALKITKLWASDLESFCKDVVTFYYHKRGDVASGHNHESHEQVLREQQEAADFNDDFKFSEAYNSCGQVENSVEQLLGEFGVRNVEKNLEGYEEDLSRIPQAKVTARKMLAEMNSSSFNGLYSKRSRLKLLISMHEILGDNKERVKKWRQTYKKLTDLHDKYKEEYRSLIAEYFQMPTNFKEGVESNHPDLAIKITSLVERQYDFLANEIRFPDNAIRDNNARMLSVSSGEKYLAIAIYAVQKNKDETMTLHYGWYEKTESGEQKVVFIDRFEIPQLLDKDAIALAKRAEAKRAESERQDAILKQKKQTEQDVANYAAQAKAQAEAELAKAKTMIDDSQNEIGGDSEKIKKNSVSSLMGMLVSILMLVGGLLLTRDSWSEKLNGKVVETINIVCCVIALFSSVIGLVLLFAGISGAIASLLHISILGLFINCLVMITGLLLSIDWIQNFDFRKVGLSDSLAGKIDSVTEKYGTQIKAIDHFSQYIGYAAVVSGLLMLVGLL